MGERNENIGSHKLSIAERIILVQDIWDSIAVEQGYLDLDESQKAELDRRLNEHLASPEEGNTWGKLKRRIDRHDKRCCRP